jgi:hypothetical protein
VIVTSQQHVVNVSDELGSCNAVLFCHFPTRLTWLVASYSAGFIAAKTKVSVAVKTTVLSWLHLKAEVTLVCLTVQQTARYFDTEVRKACMVDDQAALQKWQQRHCDCNSQQHVVNVSDEMGSCNAVLFCHFPTRLTCLVGCFLFCRHVSLQQDTSLRAVKTTVLS